jgi:hypothetical protein|tara:strand:+ start:57 stop:440 length:384 start_codon:yes stop_codon:yes gene_type:complete
MEYTFGTTSEVSDLYKDVHGFRPNSRWYEIWDSSVDEVKQRLWHELLVDLKYVLKEERERKERSIEIFNEQVDSIAELTGVDNKTALRWFIQSLNLNSYEDGEEVCYKLGLPYSYTSIFSKELEDIR